MSKLPDVTGQEIVAALRRIGFYIQSTRGSHVRMYHADGRRVSVPVHAGRSVPKGTLRQILREAELRVEEFIRLLR
jgi:predicted RNA binding protein YcfA (HicA-like mRNA interferase family)